MNVESWIAVTTIFITLVLNLVQNIKLSQQMKLQMFTEYTKRFQDIMLNLPLGIFSQEYDFEIDRDRIMTQKYLRMYFDLCSEEYYLYKSKKIDNSVWKEWSSGILANIKIKHIAMELQTIGIRKDFYSEFISYLQNQGIIFEN